MERFNALFEEMKQLALEMVPKILGDHGDRGIEPIREDIKGTCPQGSNSIICIHGSRNLKRHGGNNSTPGSFHAASLSNIEISDQKKLYIGFGNSCEAGYVPFHSPQVRNLPFFDPKFNSIMEGIV